MNFNQPQYLWLSLAALIPWIVYLLQIFFALKQRVPSLIFAQEASKSGFSARKRFLIYCIQSIILFLPGIIMSNPQKKIIDKKYFCIVDDLERTQWNKKKYEEMKDELNVPCDYKYYSLVSLSQNKISLTDERNLHRNEVVHLQKTLLYWQETLKDKITLLIVPENNYEENIEKAVNFPVYFYTVPVEEKKNRYFEKVNISLHPFDYRKRELFIKANLPFSKNSRIVIEREDEQISAFLDDNAEYRATLDVNFKKEFEEIKIILHGDEYFNDNTSYSLILKHGPYSFKPLPAGIPKTALSVLNLSELKFPYRWFQKTNAKKEIKIGYSKNILNEDNIIYFTTGELRKGHRFLESSFDLTSDIWQKYFIKTTYDFSNVEEPSQILGRFTDGTAAVLKFINKSAGLFLFDPDSAEDELQTSIYFPAQLLEHILNMISDKMIITILTETERNILFSILDKEPYIPRIIEKKENNKTNAYIIAQKHPLASYITQKNYPDEYLYKIEKENRKNIYRDLFLSVFIILMSFAVYLDAKTWQK
ncbi:MAG: BatA domain-containing protein [Spirochaetia bacterium]|nr:BatA domain-containing protein [Spirochaetia bacterium]